MTLAALWFVLCRHLSSEWSLNEQYSYGWFVPFFAAYLFWLRWETRPVAAGNCGLRIADCETQQAKSERPPRAELSGNGDRLSVDHPHNEEPTTNNPLAAASAQFAIAAAAVGALLLLLPIRLFELANPDWRPLGWLHAGVVVAFTLAVIWRAGGAAWVKHFAFPVAFIFVAVPWVTPVEQPVVQGLMRGVAAIASETLNLLGIPAQLEGSLIRVNTGLVGVNEACSGVRSLQTSIMIGLLFGELKWFTLGRRIALLGGALAIALLANCLRALFLVWIAATDKVSAVAQWHDVAGYVIVGAVFIGTMVIAASLGRRRIADGELGIADGGLRIATSGKQIVDGETRTAESGSPITERRSGIAEPFEDARHAGENQPAFSSNSAIRHPQSAIPSSAIRIPRFAISVLIWIAAVEIAVESWYRVHEQRFAEAQRWSVQWPTEAEGFRNLPVDAQVKATLLFDHADEASWMRAAEQSEPSAPRPAQRCIGFFFQWNPGGTSVVRARAHRPDICLPSAGWRQTEDAGLQSYTANANLQLPFRHFRFKNEAGAVTADTFFCIYEDRLVGWDELATYIPDEQTSYAARFRNVRNGVRNMGQQVMQFIVLSDGSDSARAMEKSFAEQLPRLVVMRPERG